MAERLAAQVVAALGRTWRQRLVLVAIAVGGLVVTAGALAGLLANVR